jgi:hypothetical protein
VTREQIEAMNLPMRPSKKTGQRGMGVGAWSVEVDAISPAELRQIVEDCIYLHIDPIALKRTETIEDAERASLATVIRNLPALPPLLTKRQVSQMTDDELLDELKAATKDNHPAALRLLLDESVRRGWQDEDAEDK